jgi:hypothetical protein
VGTGHYPDSHLGLTLRFPHRTPLAASRSDDLPSPAPQGNRAVGSERPWRRSVQPKAPLGHASRCGPSPLPTIRSTNQPDHALKNLHPSPDTRRKLPSSWSIPYEGLYLHLFSKSPKNSPSCRLYVWVMSHGQPRWPIARLPRICGPNEHLSIQDGGWPGAGSQRPVGRKEGGA